MNEYKVPALIGAVLGTSVAIAIHVIKEKRNQKRNFKVIKYYPEVVE